MKHNSIRHNFSSNIHLYENMKKRVMSIVSKAIEEKDQAVIALSGGSTPKQFFELLAEADLLWEKVYITLVDERWVDAEHSDSNEYLVRHSLMKGKASKANFIGLKDGEDTVMDALKTCKKNLQQLHDDFDLVILGMGEDGHTASFFPGAKELSSALSSDETCVAITPPKAKYKRITLTLSRLLKSKNIFLHIEGSKKFKVLNEALKEGGVEQMPIRAFIHRDTRPYLEVFYA